MPVSVKPLDLQASVPKSVEVGRVVKRQMDEGENIHRDLASSFRNEVERSQRQVRDATKAGEARVERDAGRSKQGGSRRDKPEEGPERPDIEEVRDDGAHAKDPRKGGIIDVTL